MLARYVRRLLGLQGPITNTNRENAADNEAVRGVLETITPDDFAAKPSVGVIEYIRKALLGYFWPYDDLADEAWQRLSPQKRRNLERIMRKMYLEGEPWARTERRIKDSVSALDAFSEAEARAIFAEVEKGGNSPEEGRKAQQRRSRAGPPRRKWRGRRRGGRGAASPHVPSRDPLSPEDTWMLTFHGN